MNIFSWGKKKKLTVQIMHGTIWREGGIQCLDLPLLKCLNKPQKLTWQNLYKDTSHVALPQSDSPFKKCYSAL